MCVREHEQLRHVQHAHLAESAERQSIITTVLRLPYLMDIVSTFDDYLLPALKNSSINRDSPSTVSPIDTIPVNFRRCTWASLWTKGTEFLPCLIFEGHKSRKKIFHLAYTRELNQSIFPIYSIPLWLPYLLETILLETSANVQNQLIQSTSPMYSIPPATVLSIDIPHVQYPPSGYRTCQRWCAGTGRRCGSTSPSRRATATAGPSGKRDR